MEQKEKEAKNLIRIW